MYGSQQHLTSKQQKQQGSFYTPKKLALRMAELLFLKTKQPIIDPCVGYGALLQAVKDTYNFIDNEDLYGIDTDIESIKYCLRQFPGGNFQLGNALTDPFTEKEFWTKDPFETWKEYCLRKPSFKRNFGVKN